MVSRLLRGETSAGRAHVINRVRRYFHAGGRVSPAIFILIWAAFHLCATRADADQANLIRNGDFSRVENGKPKYWASQGDPRISIVNGPEGKKAVKIEWIKNARWHIFKQDNVLETKKGQKLYISFWVKKENTDLSTAMLWIMRINPWSAVYKTSFPVSEEWRKIEIVATPETCNNTRFEIFLKGRGTLYLSDIKVVPTDKDALSFNPIRKEMKKRIKVSREKNMVWNSSFEAGMNGWGTSFYDYNVVKIDEKEAYHGKKCARIDFYLKSLPLGYKDYPIARKIIHKNIRFVTRGWTRLEKGRDYTLSLYLKSNKGQRVKIGMFFMTDKRKVKPVNVTARWQRYEFNFTAPDIFAFVGVESSTSDYTEKLWIDAVQLEKGNKATKYVTKYPVETAFYSGREGNIFYKDEKVLFDMESYFEREGISASVDLKVTDYTGKVEYSKEFSISRGLPVANIQIPIRGNGYYEIKSRVKGEGFEYELKEPFVIIFPYTKRYGVQPSRFGINHSYYTDLFLRLGREAGIGWIRDWSLTWDTVEPRQGKFDFTMPDTFYDRAKKLNMKILAIFPNPSSEWASTAPPGVRGRKLGDSVAYAWYLPRDMKYFGTYVRTCMERYKDVVGAWEVFNEPYKAQGFDINEKYVDFLTIVKKEARKIGGDVKVLRAGQRYLNAENNDKANRIADVLSEHPYFFGYDYNIKKCIGTARALGSIAGKYNKELWVTETGIFVRDDRSVWNASNVHMSRGDERTAGAFAIKCIAVYFSHGVDKIFFHLRNWPLGLNVRKATPYDMHFKYGALPTRFFVANNAFSYILPPYTGKGKPVNEKGPVFAYSFKRGKKKVLILWGDEREVKLKESVIKNMQGLRLFNMMGKQIEPVRSIGNEPVYLLGQKEKINILEELLRFVD